MMGHNYSFEAEEVLGIFMVLRLEVLSVDKAI